MDLRARHARVQYVADDCHAQLREIFFVAAHGEHVEQALRRVGVAAVAGIDDVDVGADVARDQIRRAALRVAHNEHVGLHRRQVGHRVEHRFPLGRRGNIDRKVDDVGR